MSVHKEISAHSTKQHQIAKQFWALDQQRELYIEEAVSLCKEGKEFTTDSINLISKRINELAKNGVAPTRKFVTPEMVHEYVQKLEK
ncbi:YpbS family protein [Bacillus seohaeanensis]|jgi:hypothetical protein|uniref:YpbS family protein n=1 Tax=Bacillus seohaeanensis TaxID=284580 RepID=A0ABW5RLQ7_9BACI